MKKQITAINIVKRLSLSIYILSILFKILHWPFANILLVVGISGFSAMEIIDFLNLKEKTNLRRLKLALVLVTSVYFILHFFHLPYAFIFKYATLGLLIIWFIKNDSVNSLLSPPSKKNSVLLNQSFNIYALFGATAIVGSLFKIMHWPYANILLAIGLLGIAIWVSAEKILEKNLKNPL